MMGFGRGARRALVARGQNDPPDRFSVPLVFESLQNQGTACDSFGTAYGSLVEMMGFEPMTPCLQGRCSPN